MAESYVYSCVLQVSKNLKISPQKVVAAICHADSKTRTSLLLTIYRKYSSDMPVNIKKLTVTAGSDADEYKQYKNNSHLFPEKIRDELNHEIFELENLWEVYDRDRSTIDDFGKN